MLREMFNLLTFTGVYTWPSYICMERKKLKTD